MTETKSDSELIQEFISGSEIAFNLLAKRYQQKIYWHARRMLGDHDNANEIVQQVLLVMHKKLNSFNFSSALYTWIYKITSTRSLNHLKRNKLKKVFSFGIDEKFDLMGNENIITQIEAKESFDRMEKLLMRLPAKQREVFVMRNFDDLSYEDISSITGKSVGALKANYFHAFRKIKELMGKDEN